MRAAAAACAFVLVALWLSPAGGAHKGITSKFTYNADVYPVFLNRCGRCHIDGGVGPMSLLKYEDAFPWAESLKAELLSAYPAGLPGTSSAKVEARTTEVDPHDFVKAAHRIISARELDIVLDWATGGTPEGDKANTPEPAVFRNEWAAGEPSLTVPTQPPYEMPADTFESTQEFAMRVPVDAPRNVARIDLLPGNPAIVRSAVLSLKLPDGSAQPLGTWFPRQTPAPLHLKPPVRVEPGSRIAARIHYKKTWKFEGEAMSDRSTIGLYTAD